MKRIVTLYLGMFLTSLNLLYGQYSFNGSMSEEVLYNYLDRAITMQGQSAVEGTLQLTETERVQNINMLIDVGAKFIGRISGWWESGWGQNKLDQIVAKCSLNVANLKAQDPDIICQAAIFEYVSGTVETFNLPQHVLTTFNQAGGPRKFDYEAMLYPAPASQYQLYGNTMTESERAWIPDITQVETQMWFYYMATRYIDVGIEAIHWGQAEIMDERDQSTGNASWWNLLTKVRAYASTRNRGVIISDAHVPSGGMYFDPNPSNPKPIHQRQLLFDFHSFPTAYTRASGCNSTVQPIFLEAQANNGLYQRSWGGLNPQGWVTNSNNFLVELDNGGVGTSQGCGGQPSWSLYGWDEISWFANQPWSYREDALVYTWFKARCLDPKAHFEMPGMRNYWTSQTSQAKYRCNTGAFNHQATIKSLWNGNLDEIDWTHHNFTDEEVANAPSTAHVRRDVVFVGSNQIYYISTDGRVHGYIRSGDAWLTTSPTWSATNGTPISQQVKAAGDLAASPDGTRLFYRGTDGYLHGYTINSVWSFSYDSYSGLKTKLQQQNLKMSKDLVPHGNTRLYYIGRESSGAYRVHAFVKNGSTWTTNSPTWSAHGNGTSVNNQSQAAGDLALSPDGSKLIYRGTDGFMRGFNVLSFWSYSYDSWSILQTKLNQQSLKVDAALTWSGNSRIYYIGRESSNARRIHAFVKNGSSWTTTSPSHAAGNVNSQQQASAELVVNPSGTRILYRGSDRNLYGFTINSVWSYTYFNPEQNLNYSSQITRSMVMPSNDEVYYVAENGSSDRDLHVYRFEENACINPNIWVVQSGHNSNGKKGREGQTMSESLRQGKEGLKVWPNPVQNRLNLELISEGAGDISLMIYDLQGRVVLQEEGMKKEEGNSWKNSWDLSTLTAGLYVVLLKEGERSWRKKITVN